MKQAVLQLLRENARLSDEQIARRVDAPVDQVTSTIAQLERDKTILAYKAVLDPERAGRQFVEAAIEIKVRAHVNRGLEDIARLLSSYPEVQSLYLSSGESDLIAIVETESLRQVSEFLVEKVATIQEVTGTTTHFVLKRYKQDGVLLVNDGGNERLPVTP
jgi:DNA-binding Lrp family transcriptional regulator